MLVKGPYKPILWDCAIYFWITVKVKHWLSKLPSNKRHVSSNTRFVASIRNLAGTEVRVLLPRLRHANTTGNQAMAKDFQRGCCRSPVKHFWRHPTCSVLGEAWGVEILAFFLAEDAGCTDAWVSVLQKLLLVTLNAPHLERHCTRVNDRQAQISCTKEFESVLVVERADGRKCQNVPMCNNSRKFAMAMENGPVEDVFAIKHGDFLLAMLVYWRVNCLEDLFSATWIWWQKSLKPQSAEKNPKRRIRGIVIWKPSPPTSAVDAHHQIIPSSWISCGLLTQPLAAFRYIFFWWLTGRPEKKTKQDDGWSHWNYKELVFSRGLRFFHLALPLFRTCIELEEIFAPADFLSPGLGVQGKL